MRQIELNGRYVSQTRTIPDLLDVQRKYYNKMVNRHSGVGADHIKPQTLQIISTLLILFVSHLLFALRTFVLSSFVNERTFWFVSLYFLS